MTDTIAKSPSPSTIHEANTLIQTQITIIQRELDTLALLEHERAQLLLNTAPDTLITALKLHSITSNWHNRYHPPR